MELGKKRGDQQEMRIAANDNLKAPDHPSGSRKKRRLPGAPRTNPYVGNSSIRVLPWVFGKRRVDPPRPVLPFDARICQEVKARGELQEGWKGSLAGSVWGSRCQEVSTFLGGLSGGS